jgi:drug/metabolite transporter (DMT)-like permease
MPVNSSSTHLRAIFYALAGFSFWVGGDMFMKLAVENGVPKYEVMSIGGFGGLASLFLITLFRGELRTLRIRNYRPLFFLGLLFFMNYIVWVTALAHLPLANFYTVVFLAPTVGSIAAALFLREKLNLSKVLAIVAGFIGVVIAVNPTQIIQDKSDWISYSVAFVGMLVIVAQMLTMRIVGDSISREAIAFYPRIAAVVGGAALALLHGFALPSGLGLVYCLLTGIIGSLGWMFMAQAYKLAPAAIVAPFHYSQIITGGLVGYVIWHDVPSLHLLFGATIIIASGLYIATHARKAGQLAKTLVDIP